MGKRATPRKRWCSRRHNDPLAHLNGWFLGQASRLVRRPSTCAGVIRDPAEPCVVVVGCGLFGCCAGAVEGATPAPMAGVRVRQVFAGEASQLARVRAWLASLLPSGEVRADGTWRPGDPPGIQATRVNAWPGTTSGRATSRRSAPYSCASMPEPIWASSSAGAAKAALAAGVRTDCASALSRHDE